MTLPGQSISRLRQSVLSFDCPRCGARVGEPCTGNDRGSSPSHLERQKVRDEKRAQDLEQEKAMAGR
jgi:hypothetical protein